jgi:1-acyl-sn-glycerol-3-phosphate acyltransferase
MTNVDGMTKHECQKTPAAAPGALSFTVRLFFEILHSKFDVRSAFHSIANRIAALFMKLLFGSVARVQVLRSENASHNGGFLLASNHISHFDPFIISSVVRRKIDWMSMAEFFPLPIVGLFLRAVDAFPAARDRADRKTIRTALQRLKDGHVVGLFPEGGIRDGVRSLLEGAPLRPGASTLAQLAGVPILPCVIVGSDRLYALQNWLPFRRTPIWIAFGNPIPSVSKLQKSDAREQLERELAAAFENLYAKLREKFTLTMDDLPHPPRERMKGRVGALRRLPRCGTARHPYQLRPLHPLHRFAGTVIDSLMCASMNVLQSRHRLDAQSRGEMERYVAQCEKLTAKEFYALPPNGQIGDKIDNHITTLTWRSPVETNFPANNIARADLFPSWRGWSAPSVFMLHSLLSASRIGYRRCATRFNELGWNACFVHLPYHYSRTPRGYWNGELAITADLIRNAEGLRQGVIEVRQLMTALRAQGCREFGVLGTSYGGWVGALLAMVERDFRFVALMAPIVNVEHAIWQNRATAFMRRELRRANVEPSLVARHFHLSSPLHNEPLCNAERVLFVAGDFDSIARAADIEAIHQKWRGSELLRVAQGHFGYRMMRETMARLRERGL